MAAPIAETTSEREATGSHPKPHGVRGLVKHYNIRFDSSIGHGICAIRLIRVAVRRGTGGDTHRMLVQRGKHGRGATRYTGNK